MPRLKGFPAIQLALSIIPDPAGCIGSAWSYSCQPCKAFPHLAIRISSLLPLSHPNLYLNLNSNWILAMDESPGEWNGVYDALSDPEEKRVLFAALDSFW